jgi:hypothetical protein
MGVLSQEKQMYELARRSDDWVHRDKQEEGDIEFEQARLAMELDNHSPQLEALLSLTRYIPTMSYFSKLAAKKIFRA